MNIQNNFGIAFSLTMLAGLTTAIGGAIAFITNKDNLKTLSLGLGFSAGVMIFISFVDIIPNSEALLKANFTNSYQWLVFGGFVAGLLISILIDYFLPDVKKLGQRNGIKYDRGYINGKRMYDRIFIRRK